MSRMASMQVLNNAFANLNHALNSYMANKNANRRMDMYEREQQLNEQYRQAMAAQNQANLDRNFAYQTDKNRRMEELNKIASLMGVAKEYGGPTANAFDRMQNGDPMARNMFIRGLSEDYEKMKSEKIKNEIILSGIRNGLGEEEIQKNLRIAGLGTQSGSAAGILNAATGGTPDTTANPKREAAMKKFDELNAYLEGRNSPYFMQKQENMLGELYDKYAPKTKTRDDYAKEYTDGQKNILSLNANIEAQKKYGFNTSETEKRLLAEIEKMNSAKENMDKIDSAKIPEFKTRIKEGNASWYDRNITPILYDLKNSNLYMNPTGRY